jgi:PPOX class probable F420-dependent enzyme
MVMDNDGADQKALTLDPVAREVTDGPHIAVLATANPDGQPQSTVIFVKRDGNSMCFSTIKGRRKTRNMLRNPRVSLVVQSTQSGRYIEIWGCVEITEDPAKTLLHEMYQRYMGGATPPPEPEAERLIVRITPQKVHIWPPSAT